MGEGLVMNEDLFKNIDQEKIDKIFEDYKNDQFQELYNEFIDKYYDANTVEDLIEALKLLPLDMPFVRAIYNRMWLYKGKKDVKYLIEDTSDYDEDDYNEL